MINKASPAPNNECDFNTRKLYNNLFQYMHIGLWSWWFFHTIVVMQPVDKHIPVVHIVLNRLTSIAAASLQSNIFLFNIILLLMQRMLKVIGCLNANQTTLPFSIKVSRNQGERVDPHNNGRFLQGKRKSLDATSFCTSFEIMQFTLLSWRG